ncbi:MAG TPA: valine--tRNA ligase [Candidatus Gracilibacteria bacterium]|nr:valine--tRNA ligase [Candidatus Gracilibacteria bacterium]
MQEIEKAYEAKNYEPAIYKKWEESGLFSPSGTADREPFVIAMPPPNATGTLHLGHATMLALEDIMIRQKRMQGHPALWIPGTDHAAIATQSVVEKKLMDEGIQHPRTDLGREKLLEEIRIFVEKSKDTIRNQIRKMGASCDWTREKYTLDGDLNHAVNTFFGRMYADGLIYHGDRIVNWDPKMQTTVADDELEYKEEKTKFYYFQYGPVVIGTARPETKFGDKVIVVHPDDKRYKDLHNREFDVEWINGKIRARVITDKTIDMAMGTGAMTITPAHSHVDFEIAEKHQLERPQIIDFNGNLLETAGEFSGMHISEARSKIVEKMKKKGLLMKVDENYAHNIAVNYRGKGVVEPQIMKQWFIDVNKRAIDWKGKKMSIKEVMQDVVRTKMIKIIPKRFDKIYFHWIDNLRDWCISRQIWWGHQIPVWFKVSPEDRQRWSKHPESSSYLLRSMNIKIQEVRFAETEPSDGVWIRDPDTLDTWFSSALWTFSTLGWPDKTEDFMRFHPTSVLETGYDILFFWVARMILASTYCLRSEGLPEEQCIPFRDVYLHGLIRDVHGQKMSKSRPETCIDPLDMIEKYGTDAVRLSLIVGNTPGNDMRLYEEKIAGYRNFVNKIWNASRFALMNVPDTKASPKNVTKAAKSRADKWILTKLNLLVKSVNADMKKYRFSDAAMKIYDFTWADYCDWYLEISKGEHLNPEVLLYVLKNILRLLHPFVPFVTEAIWSHLGEKSMLIAESWPAYTSKLNFEKETAEMELVHDIITAIRSIRAEKGVEPAKKINATIYGGIWTDLLQDKKDPITRLARLNSLTIQTEGPRIPKALWKFTGGVDIYLPAEDLFDVEKEKKHLSRKLEETRAKMNGLQKRLENKAFLDKAPAAVVEKEQKLFAELEEELKNTTQKINELENLKGS